MPGTITIRPIEANLTHSTSKVTNMDPYCVAVSEGKKVKTSICYNGGKAPFWGDTLVVKTSDEPTCLLQIKDKTTLLPDSNIGSVELDVQEIEKYGNISKWFPVTYKDKPAGQILVEASFDPQPVEAEHKDINDETQVETDEQQSVRENSWMDDYPDYFESPIIDLSDVKLVATLVIPESRVAMNGKQQNGLEVSNEIHEQEQNQSSNDVQINDDGQDLTNEDEVEEVLLEDNQKLNDETLSNLTNKAQSEPSEDPIESQSFSELGIQDLFIVDQNALNEPLMQEVLSDMGLEGLHVDEDATEMPHIRTQEEPANQEESFEMGLEEMFRIDETNFCVPKREKLYKLDESFDIKLNNLFEDQEEYESERVQTQSEPSELERSFDLDLDQLFMTTRQESEGIEDIDEPKNCPVQLQAPIPSHWDMAIRGLSEPVENQTQEKPIEQENPLIYSGFKETDRSNSFEGLHDFTELCECKQSVLSNDNQLNQAATAASLTEVEAQLSPEDLDNGEIDKNGESDYPRGASLTDFGSFRIRDQSEVQHPALMTMDDDLTRKGSLYIPEPSTDQDDLMNQEGTKVVQVFDIMENFRPEGSFPSGQMWGIFDLPY